MIKACKRLIKRTKAILRKLSISEDQPQAAHLIALDRHAFSYLKGSVSIDAIRKIKPEWQEVTIKVAEANDTIDLGYYECEILYRFAFPCRHHLLRAVQSGQPLPRTLLHPRW